MIDYTQENLDWFFESIAPFQAAYSEPEYSFLIYDNGNEFQIVSGKLLFSPLINVVHDHKISCGGFTGFRGKLSSVDTEPRRLLESIFEGIVPSTDRSYRIKFSETQPFLYKVDNQSNSPTDQVLTFKLTSAGLGAHLQIDDAILGTIRTAEVPYANLNDLLSDLGLSSTGYGFEVEATTPIAVDVNSTIDDEKAKIRLVASKNLPRDGISLGAIVHGNGVVSKRLNVKGTEFSWSVSDNNPDILLGEFQLAVPKASVAQCFANYKDTCFQTRWIDDPKARKNHLRNICELFDPEFSKSLQFLSQGGRQGNSDGQESAVCWFLWVLGFAPFHSGSLREAPDIIAVSHDGRILVVECTLSDLKTKQENKVQKLLDRVNLVKATLERSNSGYLDCIPVMITSRSAKDIEDDIRECGRKGVVVFTADDLDAINNATILPANSNARFQEIRDRLNTMKYSAEENDRKMNELTKDMDSLKRGMSEIDDSSTF